MTRSRFFKTPLFVGSHFFRQDSFAHQALVCLELVEQLGIPHAEDLHRQQSGIERAAYCHCRNRDASGFTRLAGSRTTGELLRFLSS